MSIPRQTVRSGLRRIFAPIDVAEFDSDIDVDPPCWSPTHGAGIVIPLISDFVKPHTLVPLASWRRILNGPPLPEPGDDVGVAMFRPGPFPPPSTSTLLTISLPRLYSPRAFASRDSN